MTAPSAPITRMLPNAIHFMEFQPDPITKKVYHGTCGETALASAMVCATPQIETQARAIEIMLSLTEQMIAKGWASASGATTTQHLYDEAVTVRHFTAAPGFIPFKQPLDPTALHTYLLHNAGVFPIVLEIANGKALDGGNLQYHFICIVGINPKGYVCNDGDNATGLVTYSWAQLEAAVPCGLLGLEMIPAPKPVTAPAPTVASLQAQLAQANASVTALKAQLATAAAKLASVQELSAAHTTAIKADVAQLRATADALDKLTQ